MSPEVWHGINHTSQALICIVYSLAKRARVAVWAAKAECVSKGIFRAEVRLAPCPTRASVVD